MPSSARLRPRALRAGLAVAPASPPEVGLAERRPAGAVHRRWQRPPWRQPSRARRPRLAWQSRRARAGGRRRVRRQRRRPVPRRSCRSSRPAWRAAHAPHGVDRRAFAGPRLRSAARSRADRYTGGVAEFATSIVPSCAARSSDSARVSSASGAAFLLEHVDLRGVLLRPAGSSRPARHGGRHLDQERRVTGAVRSGAAASAGLSV